MNILKKYKRFLLFAGILLAAFSFKSVAQVSKGDFRTLEQLENSSEDMYMKVNSILAEYPDFTYKYIYDNGKIDNIKIKGVKNDIDKSRLKVLLYDLKKNKEAMLDLPNRSGVYYSVDQKATPKNGYQAYHQNLQNNLTYPSDAKNAGVEGTVYVKFVVNKNGNIPYAVADENIESPYKNYVNEMKKDAIKAVKATSGDWDPGMVKNVPVATWVMVPVDFNFKKDPNLPMLIQ